MAKNKNKKLTITDLVNLMCYNLAQFSFLEKKYTPLKNCTDYTSILNSLGLQIQINSKKMSQKAQTLKKDISKLQNPNDKAKKEQLEKELQELLNSPYNFEWAWRDIALAKHVAKSFFLLGDFEVLVADAKKEATPIDSAGKKNLIGNSPFVRAKYMTHYHTLTSIDPLIDNNLKGNKANHEPVELLLSQTKPEYPVYHQIWINDHLILKSNQLSDQSLYDHLQQNPHQIANIFHLIAHAEKIEKQAGNNLTQELLNTEIEKARIENLKREIENYLEQYSLITIEQLGQLIKKLKQNDPTLAQTDCFEKLNQIQGIKQPFTQDEIDQMNNYLTIRDNMAHPTEYNLRVFGENNTQNHLSTFVDDMTSYLANLLNIDKQVLENQIQGITEAKHYNVRALISLMDTRKALREICLQHSNSTTKPKNIFVLLDMINEDEYDKLTDALYLRNRLCHEKIDETLAQKAEESAHEVCDIINKIDTAVNIKYGVTLQDHFQTGKKQIAPSVEDVQEEFKFLNTSYQTDPDKNLFKQAARQKQKNDQEPVDKEVLQKLHLFAMTMHEHMLTTHDTTNSPYEEQDIIPFVQHMDQEAQIASTKTEVVPLKKIVVKGVLNAWLNGAALPRLKNTHVKN